MANNEHVSMMLTFGLVLLVVLSIGCGSDSTVDNAAWRGLPEVTGSVTLDGAPLSAVTVSFETTQDTFLVATTDAAGKFTLEGMQGDLQSENTLSEFTQRPEATRRKVSKCPRDTMRKPSWWLIFLMAKTTLTFGWRVPGVRK